jgi:hypothetical protein
MIWSVFLTFLFGLILLEIYLAMDNTEVLNKCFEFADKTQRCQMPTKLDSIDAIAGPAVSHISATL